jgi:hypothetical protein
VVLTRTEVGALTAAEARAWTAEIERGIFSRLRPGDGTESSPSTGYRPAAWVRRNRCSSNHPRSRIRTISRRMDAS